MSAPGRPRKIAGKSHEVFVSVSKEEFLGLLKLITKRFEESEKEPSKQDLVREALRDLLAREGVLAREIQPSRQVPASTGRRLQ